MREGAQHKHSDLRVLAALYEVKHSSISTRHFNTPYGSIQENTRDGTLRVVADAAYVRHAHVVQGTDGLQNSIFLFASVNHRDGIGQFVC